MKRLVKSVKFYPGSDRVCVNFADGSAAFHRGQAYIDACENYEFADDPTIDGPEAFDLPVDASTGETDLSVAVTSLGDGAASESSTDGEGEDPAAMKDAETI